ncbi:hypothetical protein CP978_02215 [Streptomyces nodosus]|uniref:Uncharacterized protein n=1 Tax=Streptomyces nodosus TaxID=40318 RepID=A0A5P2VVW0_9ACTN|nr:hypothetical protein CP978_02215 [Streptomyces nodosus]
MPRCPGHVVHLDAKKVGRAPDGGGRRAHGRNSEQLGVGPGEGDLHASLARLPAVGEVDGGEGVRGSAVAE